ncbi:MAG: universal stress protein, partial [Gaiellales bacterium]
RLLIGHDGSEHADLAVSAAAALLPGATARVVGVWESPEYWVEALGAGTIGPMIMAQHDDLREIAAEHAEHGAKAAQELGLAATAATVEAVAGIGNALLAEGIADHSDVIVVGTKGYSKLERVVLGATAHFVVKRAERPVLVVPGRSDDTAS